MRFAILFGLAAAAAFGQSYENPLDNIFSGSIDAATAYRTRPIRTTVPAPSGGCQPGEVAWQFDVTTVNLVLWICPQNSIWTPRTLNQAGTLAARPANCVVGQMYTATDQPSGRNLYSCGPNPNSWGLVGQPPLGGVGITIVDITAGVKGYQSVPYACTITGYSITTFGSGNIAIDVLKGTGAIPSASITGGAPMTLNGSQLADVSSLPTWTKAIAAGDRIGFQVLSSPTPTVTGPVNVTVSCQR